jgi:hypothetical protein
MTKELFSLLWPGLSRFPPKPRSDFPSSPFLDLTDPNTDVTHIFDSLIRQNDVCMYVEELGARRELAREVFFFLQLSHLQIWAHVFSRCFYCDEDTKQAVGVNTVDAFIQEIPQSIVLKLVV